MKVVDFINGLIQKRYSSLLVLHKCCEEFTGNVLIVYPRIESDFTRVRWIRMPIYCRKHKAPSGFLSLARDCLEMFLGSTTFNLSKCHVINFKLNKAFGDEILGTS